MEKRTPSDHFVTADRESSEWVPTEPGAPSLQSSSDLRFLGTTRPWRGVKDSAIAVMSSTFGVLKPDSAGFEERSLVKWELRSMPWFVVSLSSLGDSGGKRTADRESSEWVPTESGAPSLQSSSDLRFLGTTRPWRGVKECLI